MTKIKKWTLIVCIGIIGIMAVRVFINEYHKYKMDQLADYAKEQFLGCDYDQYISSLMHPGLSQLSAETSFIYDSEYSYDREADMLRINCILTDLSSTDIGTYYSELCNSYDGQQLYLILSHIANNSTRTFSYSSEQYGNAEINVQIHYPDSFSIYSNADMEYEYNFVEYETGDLTYITIDHKWVYYQDNRKPILTREEFDRLSGTGYGGTRPNSWAETHMLQCMMVRCVECGYRTDNGANTVCDICKRIPDNYK